jgi:4,5-dihydroxyphthalate decarboxylase
VSRVAILQNPNHPSWVGYQSAIAKSAPLLGPIMHLVAMRRDVYERHPFIATSLFKAMNEAKELALAKMGNVGTLRYMLPGVIGELDEIDATFGGDPWPYGVEANRPTLEALVRYMAEQSLIEAPIPVEELFVPIYGQ